MKGRWRLFAILCVGFLSTASGCSRQSVQGDSTTYGHGWVPIGGIFAVVVAMIVIGTMMAIENRRLAAKQSRRKKKRLGPQEEVGVGGLIVGSLIAVGGLGGLLLVVPSMILSYVTVSPDKVVIRDSLLWFAGSAREIPYADIAGMSVEVEEVFSRRGKREKHLLTINRIAGRSETIEMNGMHRAAWSEWQDKYNAFVGNGGAAPDSTGSGDTLLSEAESAMPSPDGDQSVSAPFSQAEPSETTGATDLSDQFGSGASGTSTPATPEPRKEVVPQLAFAKPGALVQTSGLGPGLEPAMVVEVYSDNTVKIVSQRTGQQHVVQFGQLLPLNAAGGSVPVAQPGATAGERKISKKLDEIGELVRSGETIPVGTTLYKEYGTHWSAVSVIRIGPGTKVRIHWLGWDSNWDEDVELTTLRKPK